MVKYVDGTHQPGLKGLTKLQSNTFTRRTDPLQTDRSSTDKYLQIDRLDPILPL